MATALQELPGGNGRWGVEGDLPGGGLRITVVATASDLPASGDLDYDKLVAANRARLQPCRRP